MNEGQLIDAISRRFFLTRKETKEIIEFALEKVTTDLTKEKRFYLRGFGSFTKQKRSSKKVRHPKTGQMITIPERTTVGFNPSDDLLKKFHEIHRKAETR